MVCTFAWKTWTPLLHDFDAFLGKFNVIFYEIDHERVIDTNIWNLWQGSFHTLIICLCNWIPRKDGCKWDDKSHTCLLRKLLLKEFSLKYFHKSLPKKKNLEFFFIQLCQGLCKRFQEICHFQKCWNPLINLIFV
jgi:hypothetical protein